MSDDWMRPIRKPLLGPVASESMQMSTSEMKAVLAAAHRAGHSAEQHDGAYEDCLHCWYVTPKGARR